MTEQSQQLLFHRVADQLAAATLLLHHRLHLRESGLSDETINRARIVSVSDPAMASTLLGWQSTAEHAVPSIAFPYFDAAGRPVTWTPRSGQVRQYVVLRPDTPRTASESRPDETSRARIVKYEVPRGASAHLYLPLSVPLDLWADDTQPLITTEGQKKALSGSEARFATVGANGIWGICKPHEGAVLRDEFGGIALRGRSVAIIFDAEAKPATRHAVAMASDRAVQAFRAAHADPVVVTLPVPPSGKIGLDDYLLPFLRQGGPSAARQELERLVYEARNRARRIFAMTAPSVDAADDQALELEEGMLQRRFKPEECSGPALADVIRRQATKESLCLKVTETWPSLKRALDPHLRPGNLITIVGPPGAGKTSFALRLLLDWSEAGAVCALVSLDMRAAAATCRVGELVGLNYERLERCDEDELAALEESLEEHPRFHVTDVSSIRAVFKELRTSYPDLPIAVAVDYAQLLERQYLLVNERLGAGAAMAAGEDMMDVVLDAGATHQIITVMLAQVNRDSYRAKRDGSKAAGDVLRAALGSSALERRSDALLGLWPCEEGTDEVVVSFGKLRRGSAVSPVRLQYNGRRGMFQELERDGKPRSPPVKAVVSETKVAAVLQEIAVKTAAGGVTATEIREAAKLSGKAVKEIIDRLVGEQKIRAGGDGGRATRYLLVETGELSGAEPRAEPETEVPADGPDRTPLKGGSGPSAGDAGLGEACEAADEPPGGNGSDHLSAIDGTGIGLLDDHCPAPGRPSATGSS